MDNKLTVFTILHNTCFFTGVLPIRKVTCKRSQIQNTEKNSATNIPRKYEFSYLGLLFCTLLLISHYSILINNYEKFAKYANKYVHTCFQANFCLQIVERAIINVNPLVPILSMFYHFHLKKRCIENGEHFFNLLYAKKLTKGPIYLFVYIQILVIMSYVIKLKKLSFWRICMHCYIYLGLISMDCFIMTLCFVAGKMYEDINHEINRMIDKRNIDENLLLELERKHWQVGNLAIDISASFGLSFMFFWPYNIVHMITSLMYITDRKNHPLNLNIDLLHDVLKLFVFLVVIIYYGRVGTVLTKEAEKTKICIEKLKLTYEDELNKSTLKVIKIFSMRLYSRKIQLTAADFLLINMRLIQSFLGLILTYWVVLIQFRNN